MVSSNPYLTLGYFGTESGITVFDNEKVVDVIEAIKGFDPRGRPWYKMAGEAGRPVWTDLYVDANTKKLTVTAAAPVQDRAARFLGVVGFDVLLETLQKDIITLDIGYANEPFMIDSQGKVIVRRGMDEKGTAWDKTYRTDSLLETPNAAFTAIVRRMIAGESGIARYRGNDGTASYLAFAPIPDGQLEPRRRRSCQRDRSARAGERQAADHHAGRLRGRRPSASGSSWATRSPGPSRTSRS